MTGDEISAVLHETASAVGSALDRNEEWGPLAQDPDHYASDLVADAAALHVLHDAGVGVLSEESGLSGPESEILVVIDPLDGSTNAFRGLSWWATSLCALDGDGPVCGLVVDLVHGTRYAAERGRGATADGVPLRVSGCVDLGSAIVGVSGLPSYPWGFAQYRALGSAALDLCAVAAGRLDGYADCIDGALGPWDYLGGMLIVQEAGGTVVDAHGNDLVGRTHDVRRSPVAGATAALTTALVEARNRP